MKFFLIFYYFIKLINSYEIAPITNDMIDASQAIINNLLPSTGVTQYNSIGWQRLAYICGK